MKQFLLLIDGAMGSGKTTIAGLLHTRIKGTAHIGLDKIKWLVSGFKRSKENNEVARQIVRAMAEEYLKQGINVIVEQGVYLDHVKEYRAIAKKAGVKFLAYEMTAPRAVLLERIKKRREERQGKSNHPPNPQSRILRNMAISKNKKRDPQVKMIDTVALSQEAVVSQILKDLK